MSLEECLKCRSEYMGSGARMNSDVDVLLMNEEETCFTSSSCNRRTISCRKNHTSCRQETNIASGTRQSSTVLQPLPTSWGRDACSSLRTTFYRRIHVMSAGRVMDLLAMTILLLTAFSCLILPAGALDVGKSTLSCLFILQWEFCANILFYQYDIKTNDFSSIFSRAVSLERSDLSSQYGVRGYVCMFVCWQLQSNFKY